VSHNKVTLDFIIKIVLCRLSAMLPYKLKGSATEQAKRYVFLSIVL
jgi:hypothetical protein